MGFLDDLKELFGINSWQRLAQIDETVRWLPKKIEELFGKQTSYSADQVLSAMYASKLENCLQYGLAMYCTKDEFDAYYLVLGQDHDYTRNRSEIAKRHFAGKPDFSAGDTFTRSQVMSADYPGGTFGDGSADPQSGHHRGPQNTSHHHNSSYGGHSGGHHGGDFGGHGGGFDGGHGGH